MVDEGGKPWLIEINSSPACDYSTEVTERYVRGGLVDLLKVVLDWEEERARGRGGERRVDTGGWTRLHRGPEMEKGDSGRGADLGLKGVAMSRRR